MGETKSRRAHPCAGRPDEQRDAFDSIADGRRPPQRQQVIEALLNAGLIEVAGAETVGTAEVTVYAVPVHHQVKWWQWRDERTEESPDR